MVLVATVRIQRLLIHIFFHRSKYARQKQNDMTPLMLAVRNSHRNIVEYLVQNGMSHF